MTSIEIKNTRLNVSVSAEAETVKRSAADLLTHLCLLYTSDAADEL